MKSIPGQVQSRTAKRGQVILAALVLLATSLACSFALPFNLSNPSSSPTPSAPLGLIAYVGNDGNIYTTSRDGKQPHAITHDASLHPSSGETGRLYQYLTWAPDGQHLAFVRVNVSQGSSQEASVLSALSDGTKPVTNYTSQSVQPFYLFWSPNSQSIAFLGSDAASGALSQYLVPAAGGQSNVISHGSPYYWDWSPDNNSMIVHIGGASSDNPAARLAFLGADGSNPQGDLDIKPGSFDAPAWSAAGDTVALAAQTDSGNQLILADPKGKVKKVLASLNGPVSFAWSPTDSHLAYAVYDTSGSVPTVHLVVLDSAHPDQTDEVAKGAVTAFFWSPDGQKIAYFVLENAGVQTSTAHTAAPLKASVQLGVWVYDRPSRAAKKVAAISPTDAFKQIINFYSQYQRSDTIWSPDSQELVLSGVDASGQDAIYTVGADGSGFQKIADGSLAFWAWK